ncbi:MAG: asparagine synthetase [Candidatus Aminicenantes bacterium RBG_16_63_16]|nr:MAG: asparagine synthetase [Candidatus Aminicenantes bacterium RBG_16_63_16]
MSLWQSKRLVEAVKVQSEILRQSRDFLRERGFIEILPVVISPITDPLADYRVRGEIECYGLKYQITKSMIFHKQISLLSFPRIFSISPNVRIESAERRTTGKHLIEFVQLDLEMRGASREDAMSLGEDLLTHVIRTVKAECATALAYFQRDLSIPKPPFERISYEQAVKTYGPDYEDALSANARGPAWLLDLPIEHREFYDREAPERPGVLIDMDLIYPEGFGEALSGGEREYQIERIVKRIERKGIDPKIYEIYLQFARKGLPPSAGFGIGIERLTRYICGLRRIDETRLFAKLPGVLGL